MSILAWLLLGLISGFIASKIVNRSGDGVVVDTLIGVIGAVVGGYLFAAFGAMPVTGFNLYSIVVSAIGAMIVLAVYHMVRGPRAQY